MELRIANSSLTKRLPQPTKWTCTSTVAATAADVREDQRCGGSWLAPSGNQAVCSAFSDTAHCCSTYHYCGTGPRYCTGPGAKDFKLSLHNIRADRKCGFDNLSASGAPAICAANGPFPCCSDWGNCGATPQHCAGTDFRKVKTFTKKTRRDGLCGRYLAPDGLRAICENNKCCSIFSYCGLGPNFCTNGTSFVGMTPEELHRFRSL